MANEPGKPRNRLLDPIDRVSEILFGLIMVLTMTGTLSVVSGGRAEVKTMILGALGCNLAWGIIDAGLYLMGCLGERGRNLLKLGTVRQTNDPDADRRALVDALPAPLVSVLSRDELDSMRQRLIKLPESPQRAHLTKDEWLGALGICLLVFFSTIPVVIPFLFMDDVRSALRVSNAVAIIMLFICGYAFARNTGLRPWTTGLSMVAVGAFLVGIAIALGG